MDGEEGSSVLDEWDICEVNILQHKHKKGRGSTHQSHGHAWHPIKKLQKKKKTPVSFDIFIETNPGMPCPHSGLDNCNTDFWMQTVGFVRHAHTHTDSAVLTFPGLSDEASTKDWEKCTIPTFLFSQNLRHQELGEALRQSSYSPVGYNTNRRGKGQSEKESEGKSYAT